MRAPRARGFLWIWILSLIGCANLWGFTEFTHGEDGGVEGDATMPEGAADALVDGSADSLVTPESGDARADAAAGFDADAAIEAQADAEAAADAAADADADAESGCGPTTTTDNCGACGRKCGANNATGADCSDAGTCIYFCEPGWANCDASPPNNYGCETPTTTPSNCGGCGRVCDTDSSIDPSCNGNTCTYQGCKPGYADCDTADADLNGCEQPVTGSSCGACGSSCDTTSGHSSGATCDGGTCFYSSCAAGWADCNPTPPDTHGCNTSLSSVSNCTMCGHACDTMTGTPACDGGSCSYTCRAGRSDCNAATPPNFDGCECSTPGCCSNATCQTTHSNGVGQNYYDCTPLCTPNPDTYDQAHAEEACVAFTGSIGQCTTSTVNLCLGGLLGGGVSASSMCSVGAATCYCWQYSGPNPGKVQAVSGTCAAGCGSGSDPSWN